MHGWALATFVKGMKIRLRKNWLSILAKRKIPQSRNCLWCDELMIIMIDMGCVVYDVVFAIKSVWMSDHALHFVIRRGVWGVAGGQFPPLPMFCFGLSAQSRTVMIIIPYPVEPPPPPPLFWRKMARAAVARHFGNFAPPPPPKQSPWPRPCPYPIMVIILPQKNPVW